MNINEELKNLYNNIPDVSFLIRAEVAAGMLAGNGSYAFSNFDGFPLQKLPDYGFSYL